MANTHKVNYSALAWVQDELQKAIAAATRSLQQFFDQSDRQHLSDCTEQLYQVNGTLEMLNFQGAQLLTAEMQSLTQQLHDKSLPEQDATREALFDSLLVLPRYLQLLRPGFPDHPVCLISSINTLRRLGNKATFTENDLFAAPDNGLPATFQSSSEQSPPALDIPDNQLAHSYQYLLLNWLREEDISSLRKLRSIIHYLRLSSSDNAIIKRWWVTEAIFEALLHRGLPADAEVKQYMGKLVAPIRQQTTQQNATEDDVFPQMLYQQALLLVARARSHGTLVSSVKHHCDLHFFDQQQEIYGVSDAARAKAHQAVVEELQQLQSQLQLIDSDSPETALCEDFAQQLLTLSDTLNMLKQPAAAQALEKHHQQLIDPASLSSIAFNELAEVLLGIENQVRQHLSPGSDSHVAAARMAAIQECHDELHQLQDSLLQIPEDAPLTPDIAHQFQQGLQQLAGSLEMLALNAAASCLQSTAERLVEAPSVSSVWSFAKILSAIELYLETLQLTGESDQLLLDQANNALAKLSAMPSPANSAVSPEPVSGDTDNAIDVSAAVSHHFAINESVGFAESVDAEIAGIFLEEAEQLIADLHRWIPAWQQQPTLTLLSDIRRHCHTLKGSGRMAGAQHVGELAWQLEALLNQKLAGGPINSQSMAEILLQAPIVLAELVNRFSHDDPDNSQAAATLIAEIHALQPVVSESTETSVASYLRRQQNETSVARYIKARMQATADHTVTETDKETGVSRYLQNHNTAVETGVDRYLRQKTADFPAANPETSVSRYIRRQQNQQQTEQPDDAELQQIFIGEARQLIEQLQLSLKRFYAGDVIQALQPDIAHALKGCANIAGHVELGEVATAFEQRLRSWHFHQYPLKNQDIEQLTSIIRQLSELIESPENTDLSDHYLNLLTTIDHLQAIEISPDNNAFMERDSLVSFLETTDALLDQYAAQLTHWQQHQTLSDREALLSTITSLAETADNAGLQSLVALYTELKSLISHPRSQDPRLLAMVESISEALNDQLEALVQRQPLPDTALLNSRIKILLDALPTEHSQPVADPDPTQQPALSDADEHTTDDLLATFIEEAGELLFSADQAIKAWRQVPTDDAPALQLQRDLHTLKGGARLAAIAEMADLTHQMESLLLAVCEANHAADAEFFDLLQRCQDTLSQMQEDLQANQALQPASVLQHKLDEYLHNSPSLAAETSAVTFNERKANKQHFSVLNPGEQIRVRADLLDYLSNFAGEVSISRDRIGQQHHAMTQQLEEMADTVSRLHDQLRKLEIETETQILFRYDDHNPTHHADFDPLELDRFSTIQQLSRGLSESVVDLQDIGRTMETLVRETDSILLQQSRLNSDLQQGLMHTRLLPFSHIVPRLERIVRQTNEATGKQTEIVVNGANQELDRAVLDRLIAPIEHILRNAIAHGIEKPEKRRDKGKSETGQLVINLQRDGTEVVITLEDDGRGLNLDKIRQKALESGIINPRNVPADEALMQLILTSGFSTADKITQLAGRGVGLDVVNSEIRALKGRLAIASQGGHGARFEIRLPLTLSVIQALLISVNQQSFAIPLANVAVGERLTVAKIQQLLASDDPQYQTDQHNYQFVPLSNLLGEPLNLPENPTQSLPVLLFRSGSTRIALLVDAVHGNREIVIKSLGKQLSRINALNGATILGDGQVVLILDIPTLVSVHQRQLASHDHLSPVATAQSMANDTALVMVVDDSITMRKATGGLLTRLGFNVTTAKDGVEALAQLYEQIPQAILLDVEMPRMDGFEFAAIVRNDPQFQHIPIIMITSRTGDKHRQRAENIGIRHYLGKPYQEQELTEALQQLLENQYPQS